MRRWKRLEERENWRQVRRGRYDFGRREWMEIREWRIGRGLFEAVVVPTVVRLLRSVSIKGD